MCVGGFFGRTRGSPLPWCLVLGASLGIWWLSSGEHEVRRYRGAWCLVPRWVFGGFFGGEHEVRRYRGAWCLVPRWVFGGFFGGEHEVRRYRDSRFLVLGSSYSES